MVLNGQQHRGDIVVIILGKSRGNNKHIFGIV